MTAAAMSPPMPFDPPPASEQGPLVPGERLCDLAFRNAEDRAVSLYENRLFGWPKVIHLANSPAEAEPELRALAARYRKLGGLETQVFGVTRSSPAANARLAGRLALPFALLSDPAGALHRAAGLADGGRPRTLLLDAILRLERVIDGAGQAEAALAHCRARFERRRPKVGGEQAPALVLSSLIDPEHCRRLMALWERAPKQENLTTSKSGAAQAARRAKIRRDVQVPPGSPESEELLAVMARRLLPEVAKAFNFEVTRYEPFRVGCYDAADRGFFAPHRDNSSRITRHRRYALTLNLNTGAYEGGYLRLPEYGPQLYAPPAGGVVVFSCSLLHLATPVTKGRRFLVVGFFWGEAEQPLFAESHGALFPDGMDITLVSRPS